MIVDAEKANANLKYEFIPDVNVPDANGKKQRNTELGKENGIWELKKHLTAGDKSRLNFRFNGDSSMTIPMSETWKATVLEIHGVFDGDRELGPMDILNAVDSPLADALIVANYHDSFSRAEITEDERKN